MKNWYIFERIKTIKSFRKPKASIEIKNVSTTATKPGEDILLKFSVIITVDLRSKKRFKNSSGHALAIVYCKNRKVNLFH